GRRTAPPIMSCTPHGNLRCRPQSPPAFDPATSDGTMSENIDYPRRRPMPRVVLTSNVIFPIPSVRTMEKIEAAIAKPRN
ncbi:MAG: hypothetical protein ACHRHE_21360, partial [Tepidisphaerales bacterium]